MVFVDAHYLLALDGTGSFSSPEIHCDSCLEKYHRNGTVTYSHQMLGAALIHPDKRAVIPLMPEPIVKQAGTEKNDCERNAAKRFVTKFRQDHPHLKVIVTEDSLSSNAPHIETLQEHNLRYILGVKEGDHAFLFEQVAQAERAGRVTYYEREDHKSGMRHRFRLACNMPLNASNPGLRGNVIECWETTTDGKVQHFSWITDLCVNKGTVYRLMQGARARWRIENETFNTLKNQGYHFEHNFGHGYQHLSGVCHADDVGVFGGSGATTVLSAVPGGLGSMGQQTPAVGKDESLLLRLCPGVHAAPLGSPVLRPEQIGSDLGDGFLLSSLSPPSLFAILSHIRGGALPKGRPKVPKDHTLLRFSMCRWRQTRLLGHAMRSARACRHRSYRIFRIKRELLGLH